MIRVHDSRRKSLSYLSHVNKTLRRCNFVGRVRMWQLLFCAMVIYSTLVGMTSGINLPSHLDPTSQVTAALNRYRDSVKNPVYSNDWAVEVHGGQGVALTSMVYIYMPTGSERLELLAMTR